MAILQEKYLLSQQPRFGNNLNYVWNTSIIYQSVIQTIELIIMEYISGHIQFVNFKETLLKINVKRNFFLINSKIKQKVLSNFKEIRKCILVTLYHQSINSILINLILLHILNKYAILFKHLFSTAISDLQEITLVINFSPGNLVYTFAGKKDGYLI